MHIMRLDKYNYSPKKSTTEDPEQAPNAETMEDSSLHTSEKKRPTSSLDLKVEGGSTMTTPPLKSGKKRQARPKEQQQQQQQQQPRKNFITRARRGRLPSHTKYEDDEGLLQALYEDPEAMAAASQKSKNGDNKSSSRQYSKKSKSLSEYPDHLQSMMDEGIPVTQWIIVLVLLGAGFYQLRKSLATGSATAKAGSRKVTEKGVGGRKNGKQKGKKDAVKQKGKAKDNRSRSFAEDKPVVASSPIEDELVSEKKVEKKATIKSKSASKKKSKRQRAGKKAAAASNTIDNEAGSNESPDSVSTDGSSSTEIVPQSEEDREIMEKLTEETQLTEEEMRVDSDGWQTMRVSDEEGWQTVGSGDRNRKKSESKIAKKPKQAESSPQSEEESAGEQVVPEMEKAGNNVEDAKPANKMEVAQETGDQAVPGDEKAASLAKEAATVQATIQPDSTENDSEGIEQPVKNNKKKKAKIRSPVLYQSRRRSKPR